jgi:hypothetical protein
MKTTTLPVVSTMNTIEVVDRRREGQRHDASPELVGLLRGTGDIEFLKPEENDCTNELSPSRGIKVAIALSTIFWAVVVALGAFWFLR